MLQAMGEGMGGPGTEIGVKASVNSTAFPDNSDLRTKTKSINWDQK